MKGIVDAQTAGKAMRGFGWSVGGNVALRFITVGTNIMVARLIVPADFGAFAVALTVWVIMGTLAEFGLGSDLIRMTDPGERERTSGVIAVGFSSTLALAMALLARPLAATFGTVDAAGVIRLMAISTAISGLAVVPSARLQRELRQGALVAVNAVGAVCSSVLMVALAAMGEGAASLAWGQIVAQVIVVVGCYLAVRSWPRFGFVRASAWASLRFCAPLAGANLISWLLITVDNLVVARALGPVQLGLYALAFNVSSWPMTAIGQSIRIVALPVYAQLDAGADRAQALLRTLLPVLLLVAPVAMLLAVMAGPLVDLLYGDRWHGASAALTGLAVFGGMRVGIDLVATFLIAAGRPTGVLLVQVAWMAALIPMMIGGATLGGLAGAGWAHVVAAAAVALPAYFLSLRRVGVVVGDFIRVWGQPFALLVPAAAVCIWLSHREAAPIRLLLLGGAAALLLYVAPLARWWLIRVMELRRTQPTDDPELIGYAA